MNDFAERFDLYYSALQDKRDYLESRGYYWDGFNYKRQPQHEEDLETEYPSFPPGAMRRGELGDDENDSTNYEEF